MEKGIKELQLLILFHQHHLNAAFNLISPKITEFECQMGISILQIAPNFLK